MPIKLDLQKQAVADLAHEPVSKSLLWNSRPEGSKCVGKNVGWKLEAGLLRCLILGSVKDPFGFEIITF